MQPGNISTAAVNAGAAAAEGERLKDIKHLTTVDTNGGTFIPLVAETLGLRSPFAKASLKTIATRSSMHSGTSEKLALKNLLEQLSVKLWSYNAKLILHYLSVCDTPRINAHALHTHT